MKCPYCGSDDYETWEEYGDIDGNDDDDFGEKGLINYECCNNCYCEKGEKC